MMTCRSKSLSKAYERALKRCNDEKVDKAFKKHIGKLKRKHPKWTISYDFKKSRVYKACAIYLESPIAHNQCTFVLYLDMRENWKKALRDRMKDANDYITRVEGKK